MIKEPSFRASNKAYELDENVATILVADDDLMMQKMLQKRIEKLGHKVVMTSDGKEAWDTLKSNKDAFNVCLLDRGMPEMNGMEVVELIKDDPDLSDMPIVMQTAADKPEEIQEGIDAGVFYYLTKPIENNVLKSVLEAAIRESKQKAILGSELKQHKESFYLIDTCKFCFKTLAEAESLSCFIANCYPDPGRVVPGLAELLVNAVEHGNAGIDYEEKTELVEKGTWREEINRRISLAENKDKIVEVILKTQDDGVYITIKDKGKGFEWRRFLTIDPSRAKDNHGRGIAQANAFSFDRIEYNDIGNEVTAYVSNEPELEW